MRLKRAGIIGENTLMRTVCGISVAALLLAAFPAFAVDSKVIGRSTATPDVVWAKIGDFCGIAAWHPAIEKCTLSAERLLGCRAF
jgi:Polyketide cyclase / dehydrase and lipid transport